MLSSVGAALGDSAVHGPEALSSHWPGGLYFFLVQAPHLKRMFLNA